jgi:hypothetical protein
VDKPTVKSPTALSMAEDFSAVFVPVALYMINEKEIPL